MAKLSIQVSLEDVAAAHRIARKMLPEKPDYLDAENVIAHAAQLGMNTLRVVWHDAEDQQNAYANAMVKRDKQERDAGRAENDRTTDGVPLKPGG